MRRGDCIPSEEMVSLLHLSDLMVMAGFEIKAVVSDKESTSNLLERVFKLLG